MKILEFPYEKHEKNENLRIPHENHENQKNLRTSYENHENHEIHRIPLEKKMKIMKIIDFHLQITRFMYIFGIIWENH